MNLCLKSDGKKELVESRENRALGIFDCKISALWHVFKQKNLPWPQPEWSSTTPGGKQLVTWAPSHYPQFFHVITFSPGIHFFIRNRIEQLKKKKTFKPSLFTSLHIESLCVQWIRGGMFYPSGISGAQGAVFLLSLPASSPVPWAFSSGPFSSERLAVGQTEQLGFRSVKCVTVDSLDITSYYICSDIRSDSNSSFDVSPPQSPSWNCKPEWQCMFSTVPNIPTWGKLIYEKWIKMECYECSREFQSKFFKTLQFWTFARSFLAGSPASCRNSP